MKFKQQPEDFQVEELTDVVPGEHGPFAFYRLRKRGWTTPDALAAVRRRWKMDLRRLSYGGLKDRHALTTQYFTILHGPKRKLNQQGVEVEYLGQLADAYTSRHIRANCFLITLRNLTTEQVAIATTVGEEVRRDGMPNYFDDQRFGSMDRAGNFVAREIVLGRYEEALRLALTAPYEFDRAEQKKEKAVLRNSWGRWGECKAALTHGHARSLVSYLADHSEDFRGALARLRPELRGLYLSAFQSHLWNRVLGKWLLDHFPPEQQLIVQGKTGPLLMIRDLRPEQRVQCDELRLPLPSGRGNVVESNPVYPYLQQVLEEEGITLEQMKLKGVPREIFFSRGDRAGWCRPAQLEVQAADDELNPRRNQLRLGFEMPRGSYATLVVKRLIPE